MPTFSDTWGLVVNEALATGLPVIGSLHSQAVTKKINDGENRWVYDPTNPSELHNVITKVMKVDSVDYVNMSLTAKLVAENNPVELVASRFIEAISF